MSDRCRESPPGYRGGGTREWVFAATCLDAGFLVGGDHKLVVLKRRAFPSACIQIEYAASFVGEVGIARKDPTPVVPGPNGVLVQPAPKRAATDRSHQASLTGFSGQIGRTPAG